MLLKMKYKPLQTLPIGAAFLAIGLVINRFLPENNFFDFMAGLFLGLSLVLNFRYVFNHSGKKLSRE